MVRRRLGCLTNSGLLAVILTLLLILGVSVVRGGRWFSPGPLNAQAGDAELGAVRSHAETGGRCSACHTAPWDRTSMAARCLDCHTDVADQLADASTLHGALRGDVPDLDCRGCHTEHGGATASLTDSDMTGFPHDRVGYSLAGHGLRADGSPFVCADCHAETVARFDPETCTACHLDLDPAYMQVHGADFGQDCLNCHDGVDRYGQDSFDHGLLDFPLTGKHVETACSSCHVDARSVADLQNAPTDCVACHQQDDAHDGDLGSDCASCHTPKSWQDATFDHDLSAFPLTGQHVEVECAECHIDRVFRGTPTDCVACHQDPVFHLAAFGVACADCHTTTGWQPARFDEPHTFPFDHGEEGVSSCQTCHVTQVQTYTCYTCHEHDEAEVRAEHLEEGIRDFANCVECHPTGREDEGEGD